MMEPGKREQPVLQADSRGKEVSQHYTIDITNQSWICANLRFVNLMRESSRPFWSRGQRKNVMPVCRPWLRQA